MVVGIGEALWDLLPEGKKIGGAPEGCRGLSAYVCTQAGAMSTLPAESTT